MEKSLKLKITDEEYIVKFPNVGQLLEIESLKSALTNGQYGDFVKMNTKTAVSALDIADTIATYSVLIPEIKAKLQIKSYVEMDPFEAKKLVNSYKKVFFPWFNEINQELQAYGEE